MTHYRNKLNAGHYQPAKPTKTTTVTISGDSAAIEKAMPPQPKRKRTSRA